MKNTIHFLFGLLMALVLGSCVFGSSRIRVAHGPLAPARTSPRGTLVLKPFTDVRMDPGSPSSVGKKRLAGGLALGKFVMKGRGSPAQFLTESMADALRASGYQVVMEGSAMSAGLPVLEGQIDQFWIDHYTSRWYNVGIGTSHQISIELKLRNRAGAVVWQKQLSDVLEKEYWLGFNSRVEETLGEATDKVLKEAMKSFASQAFAIQVR